jgi:hypothetical protein
MNIRSLTLGALAPLALFAIGCASGGTGNMADSPNVQINVGLATANDMTVETQDIMRRRAFPPFRTQDAPVPLVESEWRNQTPFADEQAQGITEMQCRIIVRGRQRAPTGGLQLYDVTFNFETRAKTAGSTEWTMLPVTPERADLAKEIAAELRIALELLRR